MAQITSTIAGRQFRLACEDGQEEHLQELAKDIDQPNTCKMKRPSSS